MRASQAEQQVNTNAANHAVEPVQIYSHAITGYSAELGRDEVDALQADPTVSYVQENNVLELSRLGTPASAVGSSAPRQTPVQPVPTGVRRIFGPDNANLGIGGADDVRVDVDIAVLDTGVTLHDDLNVGASLYIVGGQSETSLTEGTVIVWHYDLETGEWLFVPFLPEARFGLQVVATEEKLYAIGGYVDDEDALVSSDRVRMLDLQPDEWWDREWIDLEPLPDWLAWGGGACLPVGSGARISSLGGIQLGHSGSGIRDDQWVTPRPAETCSHAGPS